MEPEKTANIRPDLLTAAYRVVMCGIALYVALMVTKLVQQCNGYVRVLNYPDTSDVRVVNSPSVKSLGTSSVEVVNSPIVLLSGTPSVRIERSVADPLPVKIDGPIQIGNPWTEPVPVHIEQSR